MIVVRELIGGAYFGPRKEQDVEPNVDAAWDTMIYSVAEVQRITRVAAQVALSADPPLEIHSVDKANVLASSRLWRRVVTETLTNEYPQLKFDHQLVDSAAMIIVSNPKKLNGVILTENLFGDMCVLPFTATFLTQQLILFKAFLTRQALSRDLLAFWPPHLCLAHPLHLLQSSSRPLAFTNPSMAPRPTLLDKVLLTLSVQSSVPPCSFDIPWVWNDLLRQLKPLSGKCWIPQLLVAMV